MTKEVNNSADILDSRDIIARIAELEDDVESGLADEDEVEELKALKSLAEDAEGSPDWAYGETLIRDSYFEDYARDLAEDIGAISGDEKWPANCIDWERAAEELKYDYFSVDFDGVEYHIHS